MSGKTAFQKIIDSHLVGILPDGSMLLKIDKRFCHEITTPNAIIDAQSRDADVVYDPQNIKVMIDHVSPAKDTQSAIQAKIIRDWSRKHALEFLEIGNNGVCHAIIPEKGWILPGETAVMGDSHTCTHGAFCTFSAGVGTTDLQVAIATGLWVCPPQKVIRVNFNGVLPYNLFSKDLVLAWIAQVGVNGATNCVVEFGGSVIDNMSMDARMTITNMAVEAGATSGMINVDDVTLEYLDYCIWDILERDLKSDTQSIKEEMMSWNSDQDAKYDKVIDIDVSNMEPMITFGTSPENVKTVKEMEGGHVDQVYIGSCTNGRIEDLRVAAMILGKNKVAEGVRCIINPATTEIWKMALEEGLFKTFSEAGCSITNPSCGACLGMSCGVLAPGETCVSTTNRNFPGRMGKDGTVHLASAATAAETAIRGVISVPESVEDFSYCSKLPAFAERTAYVGPEWDTPNFAEIAAKQSGEGRDFSGKVFIHPDSNVDTDQIIPAKYLTETSKSVMGEHCLEDADIPADLREKLLSSQILIAGENFGCGSSREHAPWALEAAGICCVIAPSFARIFYENMFANGLLCIVLPQEMIDEIVKERATTINIDWEAGNLSHHVKLIGKKDPAEYDFELSEFQKEMIRSGGKVAYMFSLAAELVEEGKL